MIMRLAVCLLVIFFAIQYYLYQLEKQNELLAAQERLFRNIRKYRIHFTKND